MALDPHADREPGMDARVWTDSAHHGYEFARSGDTYDGASLWFPLGEASACGLTWAELAAAFPDAVVVLP